MLDVPSANRKAVRAAPLVRLQPTKITHSASMSACLQEGRAIFVMVILPLPFGAFCDHFYQPSCKLCCG